MLANFTTRESTANCHTPVSSYTCPYCAYPGCGTAARVVHAPCYTYPTRHCLLYEWRGTRNK